MSDVTVSVNLSRKAQGELYMKSLRQADRIKELKELLIKARHELQLHGEEYGHRGDQELLAEIDAAVRSKKKEPL